MQAIEFKIEDRLYLIQDPNGVKHIENMEKSTPTILFAHGAGAGMESVFMEAMAESFTKYGMRVIRFEFPYMQQRRLDGKKRPPNRQNILLSHLDQVVLDWAEFGLSHLILAGKSMGGRMASLWAAERRQWSSFLSVRSVICLGYPFHTTSKKPTKETKYDDSLWRVTHFKEIQTPMMIFQGTRDPFGKEIEINQMQQQKALWPFHDGGAYAQIIWLKSGDHDFLPLKSSGLIPDDHFKYVAQVTAEFSQKNANF